MAGHAMLTNTLKTREDLVVSFHSCIIMFVEGNCCLVVNVSFVDNAVKMMIEYPVCCILRILLHRLNIIE